MISHLIFSRAIGATSRPGLHGTHDIRSFSEYLRFQRLLNKGTTVKQLIVFVTVHFKDIVKCEVHANFTKRHF